MLEKDDMTIEVMVDEVSYAFICSIQGGYYWSGEDGRREVRFEIVILQ